MKLKYQEVVNAPAMHWYLILQGTWINRVTSVAAVTTCAFRVTLFGQLRGYGIKVKQRHSVFSLCCFRSPIAIEISKQPAIHHIFRAHMWRTLSLNEARNSTEYRRIKHLVGQPHRVVYRRQCIWHVACLMDASMLRGSLWVHRMRHSSLVNALQERRKRCLIDIDCAFEFWQVRIVFSKRLENWFHQRWFTYYRKRYLLRKDAWRCFRAI